MFSKRNTNVAILTRILIWGIEPTVDVMMIRGNVLDDAVFDEILRCDLLMGFIDRVRAVQPSNCINTA